MKLQKYTMVYDVIWKIDILLKPRIWKEKRTAPSNVPKDVEKLMEVFQASCFRDSICGLQNFLEARRAIRYVINSRQFAPNLYNVAT
jgi:hypothetical protein